MRLFTFGIVISLITAAIPATAINTASTSGFGSTTRPPTTVVRPTVRPTVTVVPTTRPPTTQPRITISSTTISPTTSTIVSNVASTIPATTLPIEPDEPDQEPAHNDEELWNLEDPPPRVNTCCFCVYQDHGKLGGSCELRPDKDSCLARGKSDACSWRKGKCVPTWKQDCEGAESPFSLAMQSKGITCDKTGVQASPWMDSPNDFSNWTEQQSCQSVHVWYTGHGKRYDSTLVGPICQNCSGGDNSVTCTGCQGKERVNFSHIKNELCDQLRARGVKGSVTSTGNQTYVTAYETMTPATVTCRYDPAKDEPNTCQCTIKYVECSKGKSECNCNKEIGQSYKCEGSDQKIYERTCYKTWWGTFGGSCSYSAPKLIVPKPLKKNGVIKGDEAGLHSNP